MSDLVGEPSGPPAFPGVGQVVSLVRRLVRRPRSGEAPFGVRIGRRRSRRPGIPMLCLVGESAHSLLRALAKDYLDAARPGRIPHVLHTCAQDPPPDPALGDAVAPPAPDEVAKIRRILFELSGELAGGRNSRFGRIRFRNFGLVYWLMDQVLAPGAKDPDKLLREKLRERDLVFAPDQRLLATATENASTAVRLPAWARWLLAVFPPLWFRLKVSGRLPLVGSSYRWLLRKQPNLAPQDPGTFIGFAERLTRNNYVKEDPEQVLRVLVNAFLVDLRRAYGRWPWRWRGARRMTYAVVLLDGITRANGGYRLLKLINDVRNETGAFDPLLMISGGQKVPPYAVQPDDPTPDAGVWDAADAQVGYDAWRYQLSRNSRRRAPTAWYLPILLPGPGPDPGTLGGPEQEAARRSQVRAWQELAALEDFTIDRPPLWSRRWVPGVVALGLVASLGVVVLDYRQQHCGELPGSAAAHWLLTSGQECIGISDGSYVFQSKNDQLAAVEHTVHEQNVEAVRQHRQNPDRPYLTLVYVATLTSTADPPSQLVTARERLEGVAVAQAHQLTLSNPDDPVVRVLIANGGTRMRHGVRLAQLIIRMAAEDPSIVGVVGFDQSRKPTFDAISTIGRAGLPMVAVTLSADDLVKTSPLYFQVSPQNRREAAVAAEYVRYTLNNNDPTGPHWYGVRHVRILVSTDQEDIYSTNLSKDLSDAFHKIGLDSQLVPFTPQGSDLSQPTAAKLSAAACANPREAIFFAGRSEDFEKLLGGISTQCRHNPPPIIGDDDVARYVADRDKRGQYAEIPYDYLSFALRADQTCPHNKAVYVEFRKLFPQECSQDQDRDPFLDGAMELAHDATQSLIKAAEDLRADRIPITAGGLWHKLSALNWTGESRRIDFSTGPTQYPLNKALAVLRVDQGSPKLVGFCGQRDDSETGNWCPDGP